MIKYGMMIVTLLVLLLGFMGCSDKNGQEVEGGNKEEEKSKKIVEEGVPLTLQEMQPENVVLRINGEPLTKGDLENRLKMMLNMVQRSPNMSSQERGAVAKRLKGKFISRYISKQLMIEDAQKKKLLTEAELVEKAKKNFSDIARSIGSNSKALERMKDVKFLESLKVEAKEQAWILSSISLITEKAVVTDEFLQAVTEGLDKERIAIEKRDRETVKKLNQIREEIISGADFGKLADKHSECPRASIGSGGYWGEFQLKEFDTQEVRDGVASLKVGEISAVLADDEGFHIIKRLEQGEYFTKPSGGADSYYSLAHIFKQREPQLAMGETAEDLKDILFEQKKDSMVNDFIEKLKQEAVIEYPHGTNLWTRIKKVSNNAGKTN